MSDGEVVNTEDLKLVYEKCTKNIPIHSKAEEKPKQEDTEEIKKQISSGLKKLLSYVRENDPDDVFT